MADRWTDRSLSSRSQTGVGAQAARETDVGDVAVHDGRGVQHVRHAVREPRVGRQELCREAEARKAVRSPNQANGYVEPVVDAVALQPPAQRRPRPMRSVTPGSSREATCYGAR
ncbi:hypothetical protein GCM10020219_017020 [Nonomuraea dietziae]